MRDIIRQHGGNPFILGSKLGFRPESKELDLERIASGQLSREHKYVSCCPCEVFMQSCDRRFELSGVEVPGLGCPDLS